jgi:hypothetical protein
MMKSALRLSLIALLPLVACMPEDSDPADHAADGGAAIDPRSQLEAFPGQSGPTERRRVHTPSGDVEVTVANIDGYAVAEGDIIVGDSVPEGARSNVEHNLGTRWPGGVIPYAIDPALPETWRVTYGISAWERATQLRFVPRTSETNYVYFTPGSGCSSAVGMQGGPQPLTLAINCRERAAIHEIGHALGLWHEQSRWDRPNYLVYHPENVRPEQRFNFELGGDGIGPFDWESIMLYGSSAFSIDPYSSDLTTRFPALTRLDGTNYEAQGLKLSPGDAASVRILYRNGRDDLNGDHNADLVWRANNGATEIDLMRGLALGYTQVFGTLPAAWKLVGTGDFDADDEPDLLWRNTVSGEVYAAIMSVDGGLKRWAFLTTVADQSWQVVRTIDMESDGDSDILWRNTVTGRVSIWRIENAAFVYPALEYPAGLDWTLAGVGDFDADGRADVLWRHTGVGGSGGTGNLAMWQFDTAGTIINGNVFYTGVPLEWRVDGIGDMNRDGYSDLVWRNTRTGDVGIWNMVGRSAVAMPTIARGVGLAWQIRQIADLDGDGDGDIVWRAVTSGSISLWQIENNVMVTYRELTHRGLDWELIVSH